MEKNNYIMLYLGLQQRAAMYIRFVHTDKLYTVYEYKQMRLTVRCISLCTFRSVVCTLKSVAVACLLHKRQAAFQCAF